MYKKTIIILLIIIFNMQDITDIKSMKIQTVKSLVNNTQNIYVDSKL